MAVGEGMEGVNVSGSGTYLMLIEYLITFFYIRKRFALLNGEVSLPVLKEVV